MKEILYIQAGTQANYTGTHFWNTQESYFTYGDEPDSEVCHDVSFREGLNPKGEATFCPRLLAFDHKANFGALSPALYGDDSVTEKTGLWPDDPVQYKQEPARQSRYQIEMDKLDIDTTDAAAIDVQDVRYWSDFNRLFYHPRTIQRLPDVPDWEDVEGNWSASRDAFTRFDEDTGLMEGPVRLFLEECETIQGIQLVQDTATFGSFINSVLTALRDDFDKVPVLAWPLLSDAAPSGTLDTKRGTRKTINDALVLRGLSELASINIPVQHPTTWPDEVLHNSRLDANRTHAYHTSAILSAHIETATLPLRSNGAKDVISSFVRSPITSPFAELDGIFPSMGTLDLERQIYSLSASKNNSLPRSVFGRRDVTRGFSLAEIKSYDEWRTDNNFMASTIHAGAYPLPTSFPTFFRPETGGDPDVSNPTLSLYRPPSTKVLSSITTSSGSARMLGEYARFVQDCKRRKMPVGTTGLDGDEMGELENDLWTLCDNAGGEEGYGGETETAEEYGEDEE
ncbi:Misato segment II tubulin-like domain-containing protein [Roridomyces roridus]|uniref:Misato segment II tubulin-like domain-containing protein n=1 Tax=Roridomyces roridus TaxID=1738132 RepID=A0AAD7CC08_9AGAR|nr:Misato segment II tubulin-like domain-containing protein [Roridomyces roridus]